MKLPPYLRREAILDALRAGESADLHALANRFNVSYMTIHRDLRAMEDQGLVSRVFGGAVATKPAAPSPARPVPAAARSVPLVAGEAKRRIARAAAALVDDGDIIALDGSTSVLQLCPLLHDRRITVVTNGIHVALEFADSETVLVMLTGGLLRRASMSLTGIRNPELLEHINIDKCFFSGSKLSFQKGLTELNYEESEAKRELLGRAEQLFVLADHTKLGGAAPYVDCTRERIDVIVTDRAVDPTPEQSDCLRSFQRAGTRIVYGSL